MNTDPENKSRLASLAEAYEPSDAEMARLLSKIEGALAEPGTAPPVAALGSAARPARMALLVGFSCLAVAVAGVVASSSEAGPAAASDPATPAVASSPRSEPATAVDGIAVGEEIPSMAVDALPSAPSAAGAKPAPAPATSDDTLAREARLLAEAVHANEAGESVRALSLLDEHARIFPNGWLASERTAERVMVLCNLGRRDDAAREATAFLAGRPESPLTRRVASSCVRDQR